MATTEERVVDVISQQLGIEPERISRNSRFEDFSVDSLDRVEVIMELEEEFDINIPDDDFEKIEDVGQIIDYVEEHQG